MQVSYLAQGKNVMRRAAEASAETVHKGKRTREQRIIPDHKQPSTDTMNKKTTTLQKQHQGRCRPWPPHNCRRHVIGFDWRGHSGGGIVTETNPFSNMASDCCATVCIYHAVARRAPVPENTGLLTRVVFHVSRVFQGSGRRARSTHTHAKHQLLRPLEDTSVAPRREAHGPTTPAKKPSP